MNTPNCLDFTIFLLKSKTIRYATGIFWIVLHETSKESRVAADDWDTQESVAGSCDKASSTVFIMSA